MSGVRVGDRLPPVALRTASGEQVELAELCDRVLLVQCLRYYG